jgi:hypothetical protein
MDELEARARVDAVSRYYRARLGESAGQAKTASLRSFDDLQRAEREIAAALPSLRNTVKAPAGPPAVPAAAPQPQSDSGKVSEDQYAKMPAAERLDYCRQFAQSTEGPRR